MDKIVKQKNRFVLSNKDFNGVISILLTGIRILIGWHFLNEGIAELFVPNWTSTPYLVQSQ